MASFWYSKAVRLMMIGSSIDLDTDTLKCGLSTSTHVPNIDDQFLDDGGADDFVDGELSGTGYVAGFGNAGRKSLASVTVTEDTANNRVNFDAADLTWTTLYSVTVAQATILKEVTNDGASPVIINADFTDVNPNGNDFTIQWDALGIGYTQQ